MLRLFVWVVDRFIVLDLRWVVDGFMVDSSGFVVVIWGQWVCDLGRWVGIWVGVVGWIKFR